MDPKDLVKIEEKKRAIKELENMDEMLRESLDYSKYVKYSNKIKEIQFLLRD